MKNVQVKVPATRNRKIIASIGLVLAISCTLSMVVSYVIDPWEDYLSLGNDLHISLIGDGIHTRLVIFNDEDYGPYRGSMISLFSLDEDPLIASHQGFGMRFGVYWRHYSWHNGYRLWTLMIVSWVYGLIGLTLLTTASVHRKQAADEESNIDPVTR